MLNKPTITPWNDRLAKRGTNSAQSLQWHPTSRAASDEATPSLRGRCLRMHLLTGGQRIEQLVRLRWTDVRADSSPSMTPRAGPGKGHERTTCRSSRPPLATCRLSNALATTSSPRRRASISGTTLSGWAAQVVGDAIEGFQLKRVRSGEETLLAANRISAARFADTSSRMGSQASRRGTTTGTTTCWRSGRR